jgi:hypothetical protein
MIPAPGLRRNQAIVNASVTMSAVILGLIDQPRQHTGSGLASCYSRGYGVIGQFNGRKLGKR